MKLKLILDRVEENCVALLTDDTCKVYECPVKLLPEGYRESDAYLGEVDAEGNILTLERCVNTDAGDNKKRLRALFNKSRNKRK